MRATEALAARLPIRHAYSSTLHPETIYAPRGIEVRTRFHQQSSTLSEAQIAERERLQQAGVFHETEKGHHLSLIDTTLEFSPDGKPVIRADAAEGDYITSRALLRPSFSRRGEKATPIEAKSVGAGAVIKSADGYYFGVTRSSKNGNYSGFRDVSASGGIAIDRVTPHTKITHVIEDTMREEIEQEMGLPHEEASTMTIMPITIAKDERLPHLGVGFIGQSSLTAAEILDRQNIPTDYDNTAHDFSESLHTVGKTADDIRAYIMDASLPPLTPIARELWMAAGARHIFDTEIAEHHRSENEARKLAERWRRQVKRDADRLYGRFDAQVRRYYRTNPAAVLETTRDDKPKRYWVAGIDPARHPEGQGIRLDTPSRRRSRQPERQSEEAPVATTV